MKKNNAVFAEKSIKLAEKNVLQNKCGPFAAVITKDGKIIATALNSVTKKNDPTAHAETEAVRKAAKKLKTYDLSGCEIYASCKPCLMCLGAIMWANIKKVYYCADSQTAAKYGFKDEKFFKELLKPENKRTVKQIQIPSKDKELPFREWKKTPDKKKY